MSKTAERNPVKLNFYEEFMLSGVAAVTSKTACVACAAPSARARAGPAANAPRAGRPPSSVSRWSCRTRVRRGGRRPTRTASAARPRSTGAAVVGAPVLTPASRPPRPAGDFDHPNAASGGIFGRGRVIRPRRPMCTRRAPQTTADEMIRKGSLKEPFKGIGGAAATDARLQALLPDAGPELLVRRSGAR